MRWFTPTRNRLLRLFRRDDGVALALFALMLPAFLGVAALTIDVTRMFVERREMQNAADAAALAAVRELIAGGGAGAAVTAAQSWAGTNGATDVTVNVPPTSGVYAGNPNYVEVITRANVEKHFSGMFLTGDLTVSGRAVAGISGAAAPYSLLALAPAQCRAFDMSGSGNIQTEGGIYVNSSCPTEAMRVTGSGNIEASQISVVGGFSNSGSGNVTPAPATGVAPVADPLASVPAPSGLPVVSASQLHISGSDNTTIEPGVYIGGILISSSGAVTMQPGIYVMQGGGFDMSGSGIVTGAGVMIYNTCATGDCSLGGAGGEIKHTGSGNLEIQPLASGPYRNLLIFQDRALSARLQITGSGNLIGSGTIYAPTAFLDMSGSGNATMQMIVGTLDKSGSGNIQLQYDDQYFYSAPSVKLVE